MDIQPRVLVVDADAATLTSVAHIAEDAGFDVCTAIDADGAIRHCRSGYIDLVMIDPGIDGMSGADVLNSIRILKPSMRAVPVEKPIGLDRLHRLFARLRAEAWHVPWIFSEADCVTADGMQPQR